MKTILFLAAVAFAAAVLPSSAPAQTSERDLKSQLATMLLLRDMGLNEPARAVRIETVSQDLLEDYVSVELKHERAGDIRLLMKGPRGFLSSGARSLRAMLLVSGFFTGQESVRLLGEIPGAVIVGFQYPYGADDFGRDPSKIAQFLRQSPAQIALALQWLASQPWAAPKGLIATGVSLGGLILPSALHLAQEMGVNVPRGVFVCTGAHLTPIIESNLRPYLGEDNARTAALGLANLTTLHDPKIHLPYLKGSFLSLRTDKDEVIPASSTLLLEELLPVVTSVVLEGPHINPDQTRVIEQTRRTILRWLNPAL